MKTGILGGTFNPIHNSHLYLAEEYLQALDLDRILLIPTYTPPHKAPSDLAPAGDRLAMCRLAAAGSPSLQVCAYEVERREISYTFRTLEFLSETYPQDTLHLLMGADMFLTVHKWKHPQRIWRRAELCAAARLEGELERLQAHAAVLQDRGARCRVLPMRPKPLSSTQIREGIRRGEDLSACLPPGVWDYILENGLYREGDG